MCGFGAVRIGILMMTSAEGGEGGGSMGIEPLARGLHVASMAE